MSTPEKTILIIEDEADLRDALATTLTYEHYTVVQAADGEVGIELALQHKPDLILLDIIMPKVDGIAVLKRLRADEWGKHAKIIVMTVLDDLEKIAEVVEAGGDEYIVKTNMTLGSIVEKIKAKLG